MCESGSRMVTFAQLERKVAFLEKRMKEVMKFLQMVPVVAPWEWESFLEKDRVILKVLVRSDREGLTTTEIAKALSLESPEGSGRVMVYKSLKRIAKISERMKGTPFVISDGRRWVMNFDDYEFAKIEE